MNFDPWKRVELLVLRAFCFCGYNLRYHRPAGFLKNIGFPLNLQDVFIL